MARYVIEQTASGADLGIWEGATPEEAIRAMHVAAGYPDGVVPAETGGGDTLLATEVTTQTSPASLADLLTAIRAGRYDEGGDLYTGRNAMTSLPTYGGEEPRDTAGVWSWDADSLLVGSCSADMRIVSRAEWAETHPTTHSYRVYCNAALVLSTARWAEATQRLGALSNAAGRVELTIDGEEVNAATVEHIDRATIQPNCKFREPTEAELAGALTWSK